MLYSNNLIDNFHRRQEMDRSIPIFNRVVVEKMQRKHLDLHHKRLEKIKVRKVQMQANPTRRQTHSVFKVENLKGSQIEEGNTAI